MNAPSSDKRDWTAFWLLTAAALWSLLILLVGSMILIPENGDGVAITLSVPLVLVGLTSLALERRRAAHKQGPGPVAWTIVGLSGAFALLGVLTVGIFVLPVAILLLLVCGRLQERRTAVA